MPELFPHEKRRSLRSQSLDLLRFPLAVVVAVIHVTATRSFRAGGKVISVEKMDGADSFFAFIDAFLRGQSVPIYFFIAGYVFFLGITLTIDTYGHKLRNRTHSLLIPYLSWNSLAVITALVTFIPLLAPYFHPGAPHQTFHWDLPAILETFWNSWYGIFSNGKPMPGGSEIYPQDYPLWFVRDLMIIAVCTPLIYLMLRKTRSYGVIALGVAWYVLSPFRLGHFSQLLTGFFFFSWGAHMSYHGKDMIKEFRKYFRTTLIAYGCISFILWLAPGIPHSVFALLKSLNVLCGMVASYGLAALLIESKRVKISRFLAAASFFVYAGHGIFVAYANLLFFLLIRPTCFASVMLVYLLSLLLVVFMLLGIFRLLGRYVPALQRVFAGRVFNK